MPLARSSLVTAGAAANTRRRRQHGGHQGHGQTKPNRPHERSPNSFSNISRSKCLSDGGRSRRRPCTMRLASLALSATTARAEGLNLRDGLDEDEIARARLVYPFEQGPDPGDAVEVAPGVKWMRMPLGGSLAFINVWALRDGDGWAIVDTGMQTPDTSAAWRQVFADGAGRRAGHPGVRHPHASRPHRHGRLDHPQVRLPAVDHPPGIPDVPGAGRRHRPRRRRRTACDFYRAAGWDEDALDTYEARFGGFGRKRCTPCPTAIAGMVDGEEIRIGEHVWRVVVGSGHSPGTRLPLLPGPEADDLRRSGAAAHLLQRLGLPHRAGRRSAGRLADVAGAHQDPDPGRRPGAAGPQRSVPRPACPRSTT